MAQVSQKDIRVFSIIEFSFKKLACIEMKTRFVHAFESKREEENGVFKAQTVPC